jgi:protein ImuB
MFATIHCPSFALQAALHQTRPQAFEKEVWGLWELHGSRPVLTEITPLAHTMGVCPGMNPKEAQARAPGLKLVARSPSAEKNLGDALLELAYTFAPRVEVAQAGTYTLDLSSLPEGKDPNTYLRPLWAKSLRLGLHVQIGIATQPELAFWAARQARPILWVRNPSSLLKRAPLSWAGFSPKTQERLRLWGIQTLGELLSLPHQELVRRLGREAEELFSSLRTQKPRPLKVTPPPDRWEESFAWERPIENKEALLSVVTPLVANLCFRLGLRGEVVGALTLTLFFEDRTSQSHRLSLASPSGDPQKLLRVLQVWVEHFQAPTRLAWFRIQAHPFPKPFQQGELFGLALRNPGPLGELLARLEAWLGEGRVGRPYPSPSHRPGSFLWKRFDPWEIQTTFWAPSTCSLSPLLGLPLRRYRPPIKIEVEQHGKALLAFRKSKERWQRITSFRGPWILSGDWWKGKEEAWEYQLWDVETLEGKLLLLSCKENEWELVGSYLR